MMDLANTGEIGLSETVSIRPSVGRWNGWLATPLVIYFLVAVPIAFATRERLNSDGVCYLHRAILLAQGHFYDSITGYWSPGLSWSVVPLLWLGIDPLHAIHFALLMWGGFFVLSAQLFLVSTLPSRNRWLPVAGIAVALTAVRLSAPVITPDVVLGALLLLYLCLVPRFPAVAGLIAGLAYLGKAYALPFFVLHFFVTTIVLRLGWRSLVTGYIAFALIAGPWIGILSWKYGRPTFSTAATRNRFMQDLAPPDIRFNPPDVSSVPPGPFFTNMEVTDADAWPRWSLIDSAAHFRHQLRIALEHVGEMSADIWRFDHIGFVLVACVLALLLRDRSCIWLVLTGGVYAGGFLFVVYETRYILPMLLPIGLALSFRVASKWESRVIYWLISFGFVGSAAWGIYLALAVPHPKLTDRQIARLIVDAHLSGRFATNTPTRDRASCVAFFLKQKFIALPQDLNVQTLQARLDGDSVKFLYRWFDPVYADTPDWPEPEMRMLIGDGDWQKTRSIHLDSRRRLDIYSRSATSAPPGTTAPSL